MDDKIGSVGFQKWWDGGEEGVIDCFERWCGDEPNWGV